MLPLLGHASTVKSNPTLSVDGFTFYGFTCNVTHHGGATPTGCGQIDVHTITEPGSGIEFSSGFSVSGKNSFDDALITYHVSSLTPITSVGLDFNGTFAGKAIASVTESIFSGNQLVGMGYVACGYGDAGCTRHDDITLDGLFTNLFIKKDIQLDSHKQLSSAQISYVDQTFTTATPEPASFAMIGAGLIGVAGILRRRTKAAAKATENA